jgi:hypothetical protein
MSDDQHDYKVGYRRPPKHTRFKKGQSGNPRGRPRKAAPPVEDVFRKVMATPVKLSDGRRVSVIEAALRKLVKDALSGDRQALKVLLRELRNSKLLDPDYSRVPGVLVMPDLPTNIEEWMRLAEAAEQPKNPLEGLPGIPPHLLDDPE